MKRLIDWLRSWFIAAHYARRLSVTERRLDALQRERLATERELDRRAEELATTTSRMDAALATAQGTIRQFEETTQELRAELRVQALELDTMGAAHQRILKRYDAETAIEVRRETAARPLDDRMIE